MKTPTVRTVAVAVGLFIGAVISQPALAERTSGIALPEVLPPQVLGLIATRTPIPLQCEDGICSGFFSAFCLQETRPKPVAGQAYDQAGRGDITLVVLKNDGTTNEFSATGLLNFVSEGDYTSVRVSLPEGRLAALDAASVSVKVPRKVSLIPRIDGMADAMRESDMETATGPDRYTAEGIFERNDPRAQTASIMSRLINLLPASGVAPATLRHRIWNSNASDGALDGLSGRAVEDARSAFDRCNWYADEGYKVRLRGCLKKNHDEFLKQLNKEYWESEAGL